MPGTFAPPRLIVLGLSLALCGCGTMLPLPESGPGPVALPPPDEGNRFWHPSGYSIVFPAGHVVEMDGGAGDSRTGDSLRTRPPRDANGVEETGTPKLLVRRFSDQAVKLEGGKPVPSVFKPGQFQNQPAYVYFDPGYGPRSERARHGTFDTRGGYYPYLVQEVIFERDGDWFHLSFSMHNLRDNEPVHTEPLASVQAYFDTFQYESRAR